MIPIRKMITSILKKDLKHETVYVLLSGGIDSQSVLFSSLSLKKKVIVVSFTPAGHESTDFKSAKKIADTLSLDFLPVYLPTDLDTVSSTLIFLHKEYQCKKKTDFECMYPMHFAYQSIKDHAQNNDYSITSGLGADIYFLLSKKACIHYKNKEDEYRQLLYSDKSYSQRNKHEHYCEKNNVNHVMPYFYEDVFNLFKGTTKDQCNKPRQKEPIVSQYEDDIIENSYFKHSSFQKGDSKIELIFTPLLDTEWNTKNWVSITGIYNSIAKNIITTPLKN